MSFPVLRGALISVCLICVFLEGTSHAQANTASPQEKAAHALPGQVGKLFSVLDDSQYMRLMSARLGSLGWVEKVVAPEWLPEKKDELLSSLVMCRNAMGETDVTCMKWNKAPYCFRFKQTATVFALEVRKLDSSDFGADVKSIQENAARLVPAFLRDLKEHEIRKNPGNDFEVAPDGTIAWIIENSVRRADVRVIDDTVVASPSTPLKDDLDRRRFLYWWGRVGWWADSHTIGIYSLKTENGQWQAEYGTNLDDYWFEGGPGIKMGGVPKDPYASAPPSRPASTTSTARQGAMIMKIAPEAYKAYEKSLAQTSVDLLKCVREAALKTINDPNSDKTEALEAYQRAWQICLRNMDQIDDQELRKPILDEWEAALKADDKIVMAQVLALRGNWRPELVSGFWEPLETTQNKTTVQVICAALYAHGSKEDMSHLEELAKLPMADDKRQLLWNTVSWMRYNFQGDKSDPGPAALPPHMDGFRE